MTICLRGFAPTALLAAALGMATPAGADQPPKTTSAVAPGKPDGGAENALKRGAAAPTLAPRTFCRDQAAKRKLFGLGRHKFLQRCRRERRKALQAPMPR